ncbi:MAG: DUF2911 domain-containing protein [Gracilimonas sp.]|nr:DUF2911 domain-containing protein [Gracilimonas sp.]
MISCSNTETETSEEHTDEIGNRKSPIAIASVKSNSTYIKVVYGQPYRQGRTIFGELLPWNEVWRTGANEATEITLTRQVLMGTESVTAGTYSLFTIPEPDSVTIILNHELGLWGARNYNPERDYKRIKFPVKKLESPVEAFSIEFTEPQQSVSTMRLKWGLVQVDIPIRFFGE